MFAFIGLICVIFMVLGVIGLCSKSNRQDEEYVGNLKSVSSSFMQWFILLPLFCGGLIVILIIAFASSNR